MRLTFKLTVVLVAALTVLFALYGYVALQHQTTYLEQDTRRDALKIGKTFGPAVARVWRTQGSTEALALVNETSDKTSEYLIRLVRVAPDVEDVLRPSLPLTDLSKLAPDRPVQKWVANENGENYMYSYVKVPVEDGDPLAIELRESLAPEASFKTDSVRQIGLFLVLAIVTTAVLHLILGSLLVGRRVNLIRKATERIGSGDFAVGLDISGSDEIALLAKDINHMSAELFHTRELLQRESDERVKALEQLRHADRLNSLGSLAAGVAHELGTPLSVIAGHAATLSHDLKENSKLTKEVEGLVRQADKMHAIVRQLLDFARVGPGERQRIDLRECVERVYELLAPFAERRYLPVSLAMPSKSLVVEGDPNQLEQVLTNILLNAIQATENGEVKIELQSTCQSKPGEGSSTKKWARIHINDNGAGMDEPTLERIFDPYFTTKPVGRGTGMGLSIAHGIVVEHGGWIDARSRVEEGTSFFIYFPEVE